MTIAPRSSVRMSEKNSPSAFAPNISKAAARAGRPSPSPPKPSSRLARHTLLIGTLNDAPFTAQVDAHFPAAPDQPCTVNCDMSKAHLFDSDTGAAI